MLTAQAPKCGGGSLRRGGLDIYQVGHWGDGCHSLMHCSFTAVLWHLYAICSLGQPLVTIHLIEDSVVFLHPFALWLKVCSSVPSFVARLSSHLPASCQNLFGDIQTMPTPLIQSISSLSSL